MAWLGGKVLQIHPAVDKRPSTSVFGLKLVFYLLQIATFTSLRLGINACHQSETILQERTAMGSLGDLTREFDSLSIGYGSYQDIYYDPPPRMMASHITCWFRLREHCFISLEVQRNGTLARHYVRLPLFSFHINLRWQPELEIPEILSFVSLNRAIDETDLEFFAYSRVIRRYTHARRFGDLRAQAYIFWRGEDQEDPNNPLDPASARWELLEI
ncbi:hypothetical protein H2200_001837 [Cladophialophora chaetospira]|uniref:Uncharacterized protein n=1 Tax=Cladophialophora chaetospira TaxID=386627 RepID=A0AA39CQ23_9EURO|nr:hypothetical protein H2200_001837 [Cladophialophora chaetospira]